MKQEHEELIEAVARKVAGVNADLDPDDEMVTSVLPMYVHDVRNMIRAANERGFELCRLPKRQEPDVFTPTEWRRAWQMGYNRCLDAVEVVRIGDGDE